MNPLIVNSFFAGRSIFVGAKNRKRENKKNGFQQFIVSFPVSSSGTSSILYSTTENKKSGSVPVQSAFLCLG